MPVVAANGLEIGYDRAGEGPPLVLAHGGASDAREWAPQLGGLASDLTVVAWDEPGTGRSSALPTPDFGLAGVAETLAAFIEALELAPAHVGGLSWGGTVALELYRRRPEVVGTLILADTYAGWKGSLPAGEIADRLAGFERSLEAPGGFKASLPGLFSSNPDPAVVGEVEQVMAVATPESLRHQLEAIAAADLSELLPEIAVPTLLVWGEEDARSPVGTVARQFHDAIPGAELVVIPGAGHVSNAEQPDRFNDAVRDFCRAHPPGPNT
jgi:pimeloyl-ACP methyl ester carboxylesterase